MDLSVLLDRFENYEIESIVEKLNNRIFWNYRDDVDYLKWYVINYLKKNKLPFHNEYVNMAMLILNHKNIDYVELLSLKNIKLSERQLPMGHLGERKQDRIQFERWIYMLLFRIDMVPISFKEHFAPYYDFFYYVVNAIYSNTYSNMYGGNLNLYQVYIIMKLSGMIFIPTTLDEMDDEGYQAQDEDLEQYLYGIEDYGENKIFQGPALNILIDLRFLTPKTQHYEYGDSEYIYYLYRSAIEHDNFEVFKRLLKISNHYRDFPANAAHTSIYEYPGYPEENKDLINLTIPFRLVYLNKFDYLQYLMSQVDIFSATLKPRETSFKKDSLINVTLLDFSLEQKRYDIAKFLIDIGFDYIRDEKGAVKYVNQQIFLKQFTQNIDKDTRNKYFNYIVNSENITFETIKFVDNNGDENTYLENIRTFIKRGGNINKFITRWDKKENKYINYNSLFYLIAYYRAPNLPNLLDKLIALGMEMNILNAYQENYIFSIKNLYDIDTPHVSRVLELVKKNNTNINQINYKLFNVLLDILINGYGGITRNIVNKFLFSGINLNYRTGGDECIHRYIDSYVNVVTAVQNGMSIDVIFSDGTDMYDQTHNLDRIEDGKIKAYLFQHGVRGYLKYKKPMFYLPLSLSDCPNKTTDGLTDIDDKDAIIIMFKNYEIHPVTHQHVQEPFCIDVGEIESLYFNQSGGEFVWRQPTTTYLRLGFPVIDDRTVLTDLIKVLTTLYHTQVDPKKKDIIRDITSYVQTNVTEHFVNEANYTAKVKEMVNSLIDQQKQILYLFVWKILEMGHYMRRWGGDEIVNDNHVRQPYPMYFGGNADIMFSDGSLIRIEDAYMRKIINRPRPSKLKDEISGVTYVEDIAGEKLSEIDSFIREYFSLKYLQEVKTYMLQNPGVHVLDVLKYAEDRIFLFDFLKQIDPNLPISQILAYNGTDTFDIGLTNRELLNHIDHRIAYNTGLKKVYDEIYEYTLKGGSGEDGFLFTGYKLHSTLDAMRPEKLGGNIKEKELGDCIQLRAHYFVVTAYIFITELLPQYNIPNFDMNIFRSMHY